MGVLLDELLELDLGCVPHVLARLAAELDADSPTIREVAERLSADQRHGRLPLPSPLPLVPSIVRRFDATQFDDRDRELLTALSVCLDGGLDALLEFDGRSAAAIAAAPVGEHIRVHAGHSRFADPRLSIWIRATTGTAAIAGVHERLSAIFRRRGDRVSEGWHRARASLEAAPETAVELTVIARQLSEAGHPERALLLAREAAEHAVGGAREEAHLVAGASAVGAGFAAEAVAWFGGLYPHAAERRRLQALGGLFVAQAFEQG
ncbi:hypothetical protein ACNPM4_10715, partial [Microbacterium sp. AGC62]